MFITESTMKHEITSWRIDGASESIIPANAPDGDGETGTHVVLVVDASGSMRKSDVPNYPNRTAAVYDCLVKDFLKQQLQQQEAREESSNVIVTLIEMSDDASVIFERKPLDADLEDSFLARMTSRARDHGNYIPALRAAKEVTSPSFAACDHPVLQSLDPLEPHAHPLPNHRRRC